MTASGTSWRVVVTARSFGQVAPEPLLRLRDAGCTIMECREGAGFHAGALHAALADAHAWVVAFHPVTPEVLAAAPHLRLVVKHGVGVDNIDLAAAAARGVVVATAPGATEHAVPEHLLALLFAAARKIPAAHASTSAGRWERFVGAGIFGKTVGILGLGRIGASLAAKLGGLGVNILGHDPHLPHDAPLPAGVRRVDLSAVLWQSDFLCLCAALNDETRGLLDAEALAEVKPGVIVVNAARGGIVDEPAMLAALNAGRVAAYATDVFSTEPPTGNPLLSHSHVICTPHGASYTLDSLRLMGERVADAVLAVRDGRAPEFVIAPAATPAS